MIEMIVACDINRAIGKDNQLLWDIPKEMQFFKDLTIGKNIVMGYNTFLSIGKPLPKRTNIILSSQERNVSGALVYNSIDNILSDFEDIIVIGGESVYTQFIDKTDVLWISKIIGSYEGSDSFFPEYKKIFNLSERLISNSEFESYKYTKKETKCIDSVSQASKI